MEGVGSIDGSLDLSISLPQSLHLPLLAELDHLRSVARELTNQIMRHDGLLFGLLAGGDGLLGLDQVGLLVEEGNVLLALTDIAASVEAWSVFQRVDVGRRVG